MFEERETLPLVETNKGIKTLEVHIAPDSSMTVEISALQKKLSR